MQEAADLDEGGALVNALVSTQPKSLEALPAEVSSSPDHDAEGAQVNCASMDLAIQSSSLSVSLHSRASLNARRLD